MSAADIQAAKQALAWRLKDWGVDNPQTKASEYVDSLVSVGWVMHPDRIRRPHPPKAHEACQECGLRLERCTCEDGPTTRPPARVPPNDAWKQQRAEMKGGGDETP